MRRAHETVGLWCRRRLNLAQRDDIVAAILACLEAPTSVGSEIFNVADAAPALRSEVVAWLAQQLGRPAPGFDGTTMARRGGAPMPDRIIASNKIRRMLGWQPKHGGFLDGVQTYFESWKAAQAR